jgi:hypothetical protein
LPTSNTTVVIFVIGNTLRTDTKKPPANHIRSGILLEPDARYAQAKPNLALAGFKTRLGLVDDISPATAANHAVIAVAALEGLKRINDFHRIYPSF